jgi:rod shape-determining protein MreD
VIRRLRLALLVALVVLLQVAVFPHLRLGGAVPDVGLVLVGAVAAREGPETGAVLGFFTGLCVDLFLETPLGLSALAFALTGAAIGIAQAGLLRPGRWLGPLVGALAGAFGNLVFVGVGILIGQDQLRTVHAMQMVGFAVLYDAILGPFLFPLATWATRESLTSAGGATRSGWTA